MHNKSFSSIDSYKAKYSFLIGAVSSNSGKTTFTMGLLKALSQRGYNIQPFKCGPDYIDPQYHKLATGKDSINLDIWMSSPEHIQYMYQQYNSESDISIIESAMGLYDGYDRSKGSGSEIAMLLNIPIILIVNAKSSAYSVAPIIWGIKNFNPQLNIAGVIFNQVSSTKHIQILKDACEDIGITYFGYLPRIPQIELPSRHLGLTLESRYMVETLSQNIAEQIEKHIDLDLLLEKCCIIQSEKQKVINYKPEIISLQALSIKKSRTNKIAIAKDPAFNFTYFYNIERLKEAGNIHFFSPIQDPTLPEADFVYLPGGYPEFYLKELSSNHSMLKSIHDYIENGGYLLAECGGMMYLCQNIYDIDGTPYPMANCLPLNATMQNMRLHIGYRSTTYKRHIFHGHEFHYSSTIPINNSLKTLTPQADAKGKEVDTPIYRYKNTIASYTHWYWGEISPFNLFVE